MVEMVEPVTTLVLEAPAGLVRVSARVRGRRRRADHVRERAVVRTALDAPVEVPGPRDAAGRRRLRRRVLRVRRRRRAGLRDRARRGARRWPSSASGSARTLAEQLTVAHPLEPALSHLSFVVFVAPPRVGGDARHATIVSPGRLDRSPTGTATSRADRGARARAADGRDVRRGERHRHDASVGRVVGRTQVGGHRRGRPRDHRPRVDHGLPPARRRPRPTRSARASSSATPGAPGDVRRNPKRSTIVPGRPPCGRTTTRPCRARRRVTRTRVPLRGLHTARARCTCPA